jgi:catechol 2,3-dioxygenase
MTTVAEIVTRPVEAPDFDILRAGYPELLVTDLDASEKFYSELLGLIVAGRTEDAVYFRGWEERSLFSLVIRQAPVAAVGRLAFRVRSPEDLDRAERWFSARGAETAWVDREELGMGRALRTSDPMGYPLELYYAMDRVESQLQRFDLHRGAPVLRFDHFNLHTPDVAESFAFWRALGFRCSEYIATDGDAEQLTAAWMLRKPGVHDVALTAGTGPRVHHVAWWVGEPAGILRACDQLAGARHSDVIERGPGRHGVSNAFFVYLRDPDGHRIELYSCDYWTGDPDHEPLRWSTADPRCRSFWGTRAPDSWYEESSRIIGPDGEVVPTRAAGVDERDTRSEVMA